MSQGKDMNGYELSGAGGAATDGLSWAGAQV